MMMLGEFCDRHPRLFHTSLTTDIDSFFQHGILSSHDIQRRFSALDKTTRVQRYDCVTVTASEKGQFILRDQRPLKEVFFDRALEPGVTREQWLQILNQHTFYFLDINELQKLLTARSYRNRARIIIELKSETVITEELERCKVTSFNVGAALFPNATKRGANSLVPLRRHLETGSKKPPREFLIEGALENLSRHYYSHRILQSGEMY